MKLEEYARDKNVLFITTHRIDYIRNTQEIRILRENAKSLDLLYGKKGKHLFSAIKIFFTTLFRSSKKYDVVFVAYMCQLVTPFLNRKFKNNTLIVDFFISLYDSLVFDRQRFKEGSFFAKLVYHLDKLSLKNADLIIADTKAHAKYFAEEFGVDEDREEVIYLEADSDIYFPTNEPKPVDLQDKYVVLYFGTVIPLQGFDVILDAIRILSDNSNIHFFIIGPIATRYEKVETGNVTYIDWLSQVELARHIAMSDLCLAGHFNDSIKKAHRTIPGKAYIYDKMEKNIILGDSTANHELYTEDERHHFVRMGDAGLLAEKIVELSEKTNE